MFATRSLMHQKKPLNYLRSCLIMSLYSSFSYVAFYCLRAN
uniref:Uncharacterized protein n=1 Tax=Ascaris lumbricoides TaxID=6252 RepID=A0A0M3HQU7_ASCLU